MKINPNEFCYLAKSELFLVWLRSIDAKLHDGLIEHLKAGLGCTSNKAKMLEVLRALIRDNRIVVLLERFLRQNFPALIVDDAKTAVLPERVQNKHRVFTYYDPTLATFPRRLIFIGSNLPKKVRDFCAGQFYCEHVIVEDRAYVEYVPNDSAAIKPNIPEKNWQIRGFRKRSGI